MTKFAGLLLISFAFGCSGRLPWVSRQYAELVSYSSQDEKYTFRYIDDRSGVQTKIVARPTGINFGKFTAGEVGKNATGCTVGKKWKLDEFHRVGEKYLSLQTQMFGATVETQFEVILESKIEAASH